MGMDAVYENPAKTSDPSTQEFAPKAEMNSVIQRYANGLRSTVAQIRQADADKRPLDETRLIAGFSLDLNGIGYYQGLTHTGSFDAKGARAFGGEFTNKFGEREQVIVTTRQNDSGWTIIETTSTNSIRQEDQKAAKAGRIPFKANNRILVIPREGSTGKTVDDYDLKVSDLSPGLGLTNIELRQVLTDAVDRSAKGLLDATSQVSSSQ